VFLETQDLENIEVGKFQKIEDLINKLLLSFISLFKNLVQKATPKKVTKAIDTTKSSIKNKTDKVGATTKKAKDKSLHSIFKVRDVIFGVKAKIIVLIGTIIAFIKAFNLSQIEPAKIKVLLKKVYTPLANKINSLFSSIQPQTVAGVVVGTTVISLGSLGVYTSSKNISEKKAAAREPASKVEEATAISKRAHYYKQQEKEFRILNQFMPLYVKSSKKTRSIRVDFTFVSSNRYIKEYFQKNIFLIKDKLNSTLEPIVPSFPLEKEGQKILKDKIRSELNILIKDRKIKGTIKEVHIHSILAG